MIRFLFPLIFSTIFFSATAQQKADVERTIYSPAVKDSFTLQLKKPKGFDASKAYDVVYITDATLGLGRFVLDSVMKIPDDCVVVAIGQFGNTHEKRRRDFIPSDVTGNRTDKFGNADLFYNFLRDSIVPAALQMIPKQKKKILVGHSFGGLFCLYAAMKDDAVFSSFFAISPSVWANSHELLAIQKQFLNHPLKHPATVHIYAGSLEVFNKVLASAREFYARWSAQKDPKLKLGFEEIPWANHLSIRRPVLEKLFKTLND